MTPKEKAKELLDRYEYLRWHKTEVSQAAIDKEGAKLCALIAVDEIMKDYAYMLGKGAIDFIKTPNPLGYWFEVKEEIEKP